MPKYDICCLGHITLDKVVTPQRTVYMPGGTSFYFSHAIRHFQDVDYLLITSLGESEMPVVEELRNLGVAVQASTSGKSVYFENIYGENQDNRTQRVLAKADPFALHQVQNVDATYFHLGALLADDFPLQMLKELSQRGLVSVDAQGYLREVREQQVHAIDWHNKPEALRYIHTLKVNEQEMEILTGSADIRTAARQLYDWGVREVLITLGSLPLKYGCSVVLPAYCANRWRALAVHALLADSLVHPPKPVPVAKAPSASAAENHRQATLPSESR